MFYYYYPSCTWTKARGISRPSLSRFKSSPWCFRLSVQSRSTTGLQNGHRSRFPQTGPGAPMGYLPLVKNVWAGCCVRRACPQYWRAVSESVQPGARDKVLRSAIFDGLRQLTFGIAAPCRHKCTKGASKKVIAAFRTGRSFWAASAPTIAAARSSSRSPGWSNNW